MVYIYVPDNMVHVYDMVRSRPYGVCSYRPTVCVWSDRMGILILNGLPYCTGFDDTKSRTTLVLSAYWNTSNQQ